MPKNVLLFAVDPVTQMYSSAVVDLDAVGSDETAATEINNCINRLEIKERVPVDQGMMKLIKDQHDAEINRGKAK